MRLPLLACVAVAALAETPQDQAARIRAAMQPSLDKQKASVQLQIQKASGFFAAPWASPVLADSDCNAMPDAELTPLITESATRYSVKPELVRAIIQKESAGKPCAVSMKGAQGLMQLMPATAADLNVADPFDAKQNVDAGTRFLKQLLDRFNGDVPLALGAYNAGPAAVEKAGGVPQNAETKDYVSDISAKVKN